MVKIQFTYYEIQEEDFTGIVIRIIDEDGKVVATYRNFNPDDYVEPNGSDEFDVIWENQTESFEVKTVEMAKKIIKSNQNYIQVQLIA